MGVFGSVVAISRVIVFWRTPRVMILSIGIGSLLWPSIAQAVFRRGLAAVFAVDGSMIIFWSNRLSIRLNPTGWGFDRATAVDWYRITSTSRGSRILGSCTPGKAYRIRKGATTTFEGIPYESCLLDRSPTSTGSLTSCPSAGGRYIISGARGWSEMEGGRTRIDPIPIPFPAGIFVNVRCRHE